MHIQKVNEYIANEQLCDSESKCDTHQEMVVTVFDDEELRDKLFKLLMQNEQDRSELYLLENSIVSKENQIYIRDSEIERLHGKLERLEE